MDLQSVDRYHTIAAGQTRNRRRIPASPKPMAWVDMMRRI
jgi:hypothetical protein